MLVVRRIQQARTFRAHDLAAIDAEREANRRWRNVFVAPVIHPGSCYGPFSVLVHRGRMSGREFTAVVRAIPDGDATPSRHPMGERTQWLKNIAATPGILRWHAKENLVGYPVLRRIREIVVTAWLLPRSGEASIQRELALRTEDLRQHVRANWTPM